MSDIRNISNRIFCQSKTKWSPQKGKKRKEKQRDQECMCGNKAWPFASLTLPVLWSYTIPLSFSCIYTVYVHPIESGEKCWVRFSNLFELMCADFNLRIWRFLFSSSHAKRIFTNTILRLAMCQTSVWQTTDWISFFLFSFTFFFL